MIKMSGQEGVRLYSQPDLREKRGHKRRSLLRKLLAGEKRKNLDGLEREDSPWHKASVAKINEWFLERLEGKWQHLDRLNDQVSYNRERQLFRLLERLATREIDPQSDIDLKAALSEDSVFYRNLMEGSFILLWQYAQNVAFYRMKSPVVGLNTLYSDDDTEVSGIADYTFALIQQSDSPLLAVPGEGGLPIHREGVLELVELALSDDTQVEVCLSD